MVTGNDAHHRDLRQYHLPKKLVVVMLIPMVTHFAVGAQRTASGFHPTDLQLLDVN